MLKETDTGYARQWHKSDRTLISKSLLVRICLVIVNTTEILEDKSCSLEVHISNRYASF